MALPEIVNFERMTRPSVLQGERTLPCYYRIVAKRRPEPGEWYLSGAEPMAYKAPKGMTSEYLIVAPTHYAVPATGYVRGPEVA